MNRNTESKAEEMQGGGWGSAEILVAIRKHGATPGSIAAHLNVTRQAVLSAIKNANSWAICEFIAKFLDVPIVKIWPQIIDRVRKSTSNAATRAMVEASK